MSSPPIFNTERVFTDICEVSVAEFTAIEADLQTYINREKKVSMGDIIAYLLQRGLGFSNVHVLFACGYIAGRLTEKNNNETIRKAALESMAAGK